MPMRVGLPWRGVRPMRVLVMLVMDVPVLVLRRLVRKFMLGAFRQVQPKADGHKAARDHQPSR